MVVSILADLSILMSAALLFFFFQMDRSDTKELSKMETLLYVIIEVIVGLFLLQFSVMIDGARYDYRFLLYCFSLKYVGAPATISSIFLINLFRLLLGVDMNTYSTFLYGLILIVGLPLINKFVKKIENDFAQLLLLIFFTFIVGATLNFILYGDFFRDAQIYSVLICSSTLMIGLFLWIGSKLDEIKGKAEIDFLTGLKNSRRFYLDLARLVKETETVSIALVDIDHFKSINDRYGHLAGDEILRKVTTAFREQENQMIQFYRVGGEEFACIIREHTFAETTRFLEGIRQTIEVLETELLATNGEPRQVTISIGVACLDQNIEIHQSLREADLALYDAKRGGRNQLQVKNFHVK